MNKNEICYTTSNETLFSCKEQNFANNSDFFISVICKTTVEIIELFEYTQKVP